MLTSDLVRKKISQHIRNGDRQRAQSCTLEELSGSTRYHNGVPFFQCRSFSSFCRTSGKDSVWGEPGTKLFSGAAGGDLQPAQIGRASCRERVDAVQGV